MVECKIQIDAILCNTMIVVFFLQSKITTKEDYESWAIGLVINASEKAKAEGLAEGRNSEREEMVLL